MYHVEMSNKKYITNIISAHKTIHPWFSLTYSISLSFFLYSYLCFIISKLLQHQKIGRKKNYSVDFSCLYFYLFFASFLILFFIRMTLGIFSSCFILLFFFVWGINAGTFTSLLQPLTSNLYKKKSLIFTNTLIQWWYIYVLYIWSCGTWKHWLCTLNLLSCLWE